MSEILWSEKPDGTGARLKPRARGVSIPIVDIEDGDVSVALYTSEARSLAAALVAWADKAEGHARKASSFIVKVPSGPTLGGEVRVEQGPWGVSLGLSVGGSAFSFLNLPPADVRGIGAFLLGASQPVEPAPPKHAAGMCDECGYPSHARDLCRCMHGVLGRQCKACNPDPPYVETRASRNELLEQLTREQIKSEGLTRELNEARRALEESKKRDAERGDSAPVQILVSAKTFDSYLSRLAALEAADAQRPNLACVAALESRIEEIEDVDKGAPSTVLAHGRIDEVLKRLTVVENALKAIASAVRT